MKRLVFIPIALIFFITQQTQQSSHRRISYGIRFPYEPPYSSQVILEITGKQLIVPNCTGTVLTDRIVLTAAHCLVQVTKIFIRYGIRNIDKLKRVQARGWVQHPDWNKKYIDLGLVVASMIFKWIDNFRPIPTSTWHTNTSAALIPYRKLICGWGLNENHALPGLSCGFFVILTDHKCQLEFPDRHQEW